MNFKKELTNKKTIFFMVLTLILVLLDQLTKYLILKFNPTINFKILSFHLVKNTGAGFGILKNQTFLLAIISLILVLGVLYYYPKIPKENFPQIFTALFLAGASGNLIDRLFRKFVIDFVDFGWWPAFNIADASITFGVLGLIWYFWKNSD